MGQSKIRIFNKKFILKDFQPADISDPTDIKIKKGNHTEIGEIVCEVYYTPRGWRGDIHLMSPIDIWDADHVQKLYGVRPNELRGDLYEKIFESTVPAMQYMTKRLKTLGWEPIDTWE